MLGVSEDGKASDTSKHMAAFKLLLWNLTRVSSHIVPYPFSLGKIEKISWIHLTLEYRLSPGVWNNSAAECPIQMAQRNKAC
jgi:hypothetical protein